MRTARILLALLLLNSAWGEEVVPPLVPGPLAPPVPAAPIAPIQLQSLASLSDSEAEVLGRFFTSTGWHYRAFGILRLEAYVVDEALRERLRSLVQDPDWQVRCFALLTWRRLGMDPEPSLLAKEEVPQVLRTALRLGWPVEAKQLKSMIPKLFAVRNAEAGLLAMEVAAASPEASDRERAARAALEMAAKLDARLAPLLGDRLAALLAAPPRMDPLADADGLRDAWRRWASAQGRHGPGLADASVALRPLLAEGPPAMTLAKVEQLDEIVTYLYTLKTRSLELAILIDATGSMGGTIRHVLIEVDRMILVLGHLTEGMRIGFSAYRDRADAMPVESCPLSDDIDKVRLYLGGLRAEGGGDIEEDPILALQAVTRFGWEKDATRHLVIIGDAPPHAADLPDTTQAIERLGQQGFVTHLVDVGFDVFSDLAPVAIGRGGRRVGLNGNDEVAQAIIGLTLDERIHPVFGDFYRRFVALCL